MGQPLNIAMIGCGNISAQYLAALPRLTNLRLVAVADKFPAAAEKVAAELPGVDVLSVEKALASPQIDAVLNLTIPAAHADVTISALQSGKHVYLEKPFATTLAEAEHMLKAAEAADRRIGIAPDTALGTGIQTSRQLIDAGKIGTPVSATAFMMSPGHEHWHPNPAFYYQKGGGPLLDMGVYYISALVTMLGPIESVIGMGSRPRTSREVPPGVPKAGEMLPVDVDTFVTSILRHRSGAVSTLTVSFDAVASTLPKIEVQGSAGTLSVPDPNQFDNPVFLAEGIGAEFVEQQPTAGYADAARGYGLADMARSIIGETPHRQSAELGFHVYEVMEAVLRSTREYSPVEINSTCDRPAGVPLGSKPEDQ